MFRTLKGLLAGLVAGTVLGVLFAPKKGKELRKEFKKEIDEGGLGIGTLKGVAGEMGKDMSETGHKVYGDVSKTDMHKQAKKTFSKAKDILEKFAARAKREVSKAAKNE